MGRVNIPILSELERAELEHLYRSSTKHGLGKRCQTVLLKADGRTSKDVGLIVGMCNVSVNSWLKRYKTEGINGLLIKEGRGPKPKIDPIKDRETILFLVKQHRQKVETAKAEWQAVTDKEVSRVTFKRFLKSLGEDTNV
jgi:transposase